MVENSREAHPAAPPADAIGTELFVAFVYPVGTDFDALERAVTGALASVDFETTSLHLIEELGGGDLSPKENERYNKLMDRGNEYRRKRRRPDALALLAAALITKDRNERYGDRARWRRVTPRHAYLIRSLKRPEEIQTLRDIYGDALIVIAAHQTPKGRRERLTWRIARSAEGGNPDQYREFAEQLIARDQRELADEYGQRVSDAFPLADVFLDATHPERLRTSAVRFVNLLFGHPFHTPTRDEYGMFHAAGAAFRSSDLSRQVGAAIAEPETGEIIALGTNDVPRGGGGLYWEGNDDDSRDFTLGRDISTEVKKTAVAQLLQLLGQEHLLIEGAEKELEKAWQLLRGSDLLGVGEFGRSVHAEMAALIDAARRGVAVRGCTFYTTTFPCTVCSRHIVAAGIKRVVYNEPYPKSLAPYLHLDAMVVEEEPGPRQVSYQAFMGVSPSMYVSLFRAPPRKTPDGKLVTWNAHTSEPRLTPIPLQYLRNELGAVLALRDEGVVPADAAAPTEAVGPVPREAVLPQEGAEDGA